MVGGIVDGGAGDIADVGVQSEKCLGSRRRGIHGVLWVREPSLAFAVEFGASADGWAR